MESTKYIFNVTLTVILLVVLTACDIGFEELNENPNEPTGVPARFVIPHVQEASLSFLSHGAPGRAYVHVQYHAPILYAGTGIYEYTPAAANGHWTTFYSSILEDLAQLKYNVQQADVPRPNEEAIIRVMMAWQYHLITDLWGDVPYTEANTGAHPDPNMRVSSPRYDTQQSIYLDLIDELDAATSMIDVNQSPFGSEDLFYGGDMSKWKKFANSLKLRIYMRMSEVAPTEASTGIQRVFNEGMIFESNEDNLYMLYSNFPNNHPTNNALRQRDDLKVTEPVVEMLKEFNDPRLRIYAAPNVNDSEYVGLPVGMEQGLFPNNSISPIGAFYLAPRSPGFVMTYSEVLFILAEAEARGWLNVPGESAQSLYENAIRSNMQLFSQNLLDSVLSGFEGTDTYNTTGLNANQFPSEITEAEINAYLNEPNVVWDQNNWRELIGTQKWLQLYRQGLQGWFEWRRLNYPNLQPGPAALLDEVPRRWVYPQDEQSLNNSNRSEAVERMGSDNLLSRMWIDQ